ncbi:MAG: ABC transporter permease [Lachnospiraceae bacterium]|nr:ABC transporter permease [Lachnospiraceae bacterium]
MNKKKKKKTVKWTVKVNIISLIVFFVAWQLISMANEKYLWFNAKFLPSPSEVWLTAVEHVQDGTLLPNIAISVQRILLGFGIGTGLAILFGCFFVNIPFIEAWLSPIFNLFGAIPPFALLPLIIIWFGIGESSKVGLIAYSTFMSMLPYIVDGLKNTSPVLIRAASSLGASKMQIFTRVMIPNALPNLFVGMKIALAMTFGALMVAEMLGASKGLGFMIINARQWFRVNDMFLSIIIIGLLYELFFYILTFFEKLLFKWKTDVSSAIEK